MPGVGGGKSLQHYVWVPSLKLARISAQLGYGGGSGWGRPCKPFEGHIGVIESTEDGARMAASVPEVAASKGHVGPKLPLNEVFVFYVLFTELSGFLGFSFILAGGCLGACGRILAATAKAEAGAARALSHRLVRIVRTGDVRKGGDR